MNNVFWLELHFNNNRIETAKTEYDGKIDATSAVFLRFFVYIKRCILLGNKI